MDFINFPYLLHLAILCISLSIVFFLYKSKSSNSRAAKFPPGETGWPLIGESLKFAEAGRKGTPERFITDRIIKHSSPDVFRTSLLGDNLAVFCGAAGNKFLFSGESKYVTTWWPSSLKSVLDFDVTNFSEETAKIRRLQSEFLRPEALRQYVPIMDSAAREHIEADWFGQKIVHVFPLSKKYTFALACRLFISIKDPDLIAKLFDPFALLITGIFSIPVNLPGTAFNRASKAGKVIREEILALVRQKISELQEGKELADEDALARLVLVSDENGRNFNETKIVNSILGLLIAGYDTTSAAITSVMNYLGQYPHVYKQVFKEQIEILESKTPGEFLNWDDIQKMKCTWCVVCESMRLSPPAQGAFREAITDFTFATYTIPKGWKTFWTPYSSHKNPEYFQEPEKFDPSRFEGKGPAPFTFVPFGGGPRMCPGKEYARLELLVFLHNVVTKFKWEKVIPGEKLINNPYLMPQHDLPIRLHLHDI